MLFFTLFLIGGAIVAAVLTRQAGERLAVRNWAPTPCALLSAEVEIGDADIYPLKVRYAYVYDGASRVSEQVYPGYRGSQDISDAERLLHHYREAAGPIDAVERDDSASRLTCYVNPNQPSEASLEQSPPIDVWMFLIPLIFCTIGGCGLIYVLKSRAAGSTATVSITETAVRAHRIGRPAVMGVFGLFLVIGLVLSFVFISPIFRVRDAAAWIEKPCTVLASQVRTHHGDDSTTYSIDILYRYEHEGKTYRSNQYGFFTGSSSGYEGKRAVVSRHPPGAQALCYVNPADPFEAVLSRDVSGTMLLGLFPLIFVLLGAGGLVAMARRAPTRSPPAPDSPAEALRAMKKTSHAAPQGTSLKPRQSPKVKFFFLLGFALFWNGILSIFVVSMFRDWQRSQLDLCSGLFLIPFVLVGFGLIGGVFYTFLAMFNPRTHVTLEPASPRLGQSVRVSWETEGNAHRITRLTIRVEAREEAEYRRGTRRYTDRHVFLKLPVFETARQLDIHRGNATFTLPRDTMHTWSGGNNRIVWDIIVHGEIDNWPDAKEQYAIDVLPMALSEVNQHELDLDLPDR